MNDSFSISPVGEIYELRFFISNPDGSFTYDSVKLDLTDTTLEDAIKKTLGCYFMASDISLYKIRVFEDKSGDKYFSEARLIRSINV